LSPLWFGHAQSADKSAHSKFCCKLSALLSDIDRSS